MNQSWIPIDLHLWIRTHMNARFDCNWDKTENTMKWMGALEFRASLWFRLEPVPTGKELGVGQEKRGKSRDWRDLVRKLLLSGLFGREYHSTVCYKIKSGRFERKGWMLFLSLSLCVKGERGRGEIDYTMVSHKRVSSKRTVEWNRIDRILTLYSSLLDRKSRSKNSGVVVLFMILCYKNRSVVRDWILEWIATDTIDSSRLEL